MVTELRGTFKSFANPLSRFADRAAVMDCKHNHPKQLCHPERSEEPMYFAGGERMHISFAAFAAQDDNALGDAS
jgi:hypothetical protein